MENGSYIRFLHASYNAPAIDIFINDVPIVKDLSYRNFSQYYKASAGFYNVKIYPAGNKNLILLEETIELNKNNIYTLAVMGTYDANGIELNLIADHLRDIDKNYSYIRFINLSPSLENVDVVLNDKLEISQLSYGTESSYLEMKPGKYNFKAYSSEQEKLVLENPNLILNAGKIYSGYIVGINNTKNNLQILIPLEGATYLKF